MASPPHEMRVFQRVIERGSFAAAAEDIGLHPPLFPSSSPDWSFGLVCG